jgi:hypothetical protein
MTGLLHSSLKRLRQREGQVGLEMLGVLFAWLICATLMVNLLFYFGSAMLMQSAVNRAALQAGALGCATTDSAGVTTFASRFNGLGVGKNIVVVARSARRVSDNPLSDGYWQPDTSAMFDSEGDLVGGDDASCAARNSLDEGRYITVQVKYTQHLWLFGSQTVRRDATVISHNLREM